MDNIVDTRTKFCAFCFYSHTLMLVSISLCFAILRNISTGSETHVTHEISDVIQAWCNVVLLCCGSHAIFSRQYMSRARLDWTQSTTALHIITSSLFYRWGYQLCFYFFSAPSDGPRPILNICYRRIDKKIV